MLRASNQVVGGSNPSGRAIITKIVPQADVVDSSAADSNRRQTTSRFDNLAGFGQVGRCRAAAAVRSEAEDEGAVGPEAIRPGAQNYNFKINDFAQRDPTDCRKTST